ncbi:MAG: IS982 family transposase [Patescibacteria group bacterium]|nr:IS982 family transposase [Patescibacteria group bacterium]
MNIDKNTVLTIIFTLVDDIMKDPKIVNHLKRPGVSPNLSDSEIVTLSLYQELIGENREDHFYRLHQKDLKSYFPRLNERSRYNRRKRDLYRVFLAVRLSLGSVLNLEGMKTVSIDSAPIPIMGYKRDKKHSDFTDAQYGYCSSKALKYFGYKLHTLVGLCGSIVDFCLTGAASFDDQVVEEFVDRNKQTINEIFGDKAYVSEKLKKLLREQIGVMLYSPKKRNAKNTTQHLSKKQGQIRLMVETVNAQLQEQFKLSKSYAKSRWGFFTRVAAKMTAHTIGQVINLILGKPKLALADLAV